MKAMNAKLRMIDGYTYKIETKQNEENT